MKNTVCILVAALLSACGGGGSTPAVDNSAAIQQAISNISVPGVSTTAPAYTGAFVLVNNSAVGFVAGTSDDNVAMVAAKAVADNPKGQADNYKLLISDAGLKLTVVGGLTGTKSSITGLLLSYPDIHYLAKLTTTGLIVQRL